MTESDTKIIPRNHCLQMSIYGLTAMGVFPLKFKNHPILERLYFLYHHIVFLYCSSLLIRQFIEMCHLIATGNLKRLMQNMGITLLTGISIIRILICRTDYILKIINNIKEMETRILATDQQEIRNIYMSSAKYSQFINKFFMVVGTVTTIPFFIAPFAEVAAYPDLYVRDNVTGKVNNRPTPLSEWAPFNYNDHYLGSFIWQVFDAFTIESMVVYPDNLLFNLMIFPVGVLKVLQNILRNLSDYGDREAKNLGIPRDEAGAAVVRACIILHQHIISYIENLDSAMKYVMLLDFALCSFQMSVILFQIIMSADFNVPSIFAAEFLLSMAIQMFLFYWHANELIVESRGIADAAVDNLWYNESEITKNMLQVMIQRAQRPLTLSIGPFYPMSTDTSISIVKATYSYGMLLRKSYSRKTT